MDKRLEECVNYFRSRPVYQTVFQKVWDKAVSLGHFGGRVACSGLSAEEKEQLEGFFQKSFRNQNTIIISAALMQKALDNSRFAGLDWQTILEAYFGEAMVGRKEQKQRQLDEREQFFAQFISENETNGSRWLQKVLQEQSAGYQLLMKQYQEDQAKLEEILKLVLAASGQLPADQGACAALPVFAAQVTGNPHYFDEGTVAGHLLELFILEHFSLEREEGFSEPEWKNRIRYQAGILKDDLSNYTLAYGIQGKQRGGALHDGICGFYRLKEPVQCTLFTLGRLEDAWGNHVIYVVENPAVFSVLISRYPEISLVCTNGQPRLASLVLLDFLAKHSILRYAGDFDPEGLVIARNLKQRYGNRMEYWGYQAESYYKSMSEVILDEKRLKKLDKVTDEELQEVVKAMRQEKRAAYQEAMVEFAYQVDS